ncbi:MAG: purine-binding chemotaxis protein CheW [Spirochaetales bacterium]|nr:purine-binding chemotaxis protein CheW [Spirochaetales bacterium]
MDLIQANKDILSKITRALDNPDTRTRGQQILLFESSEQDFGISILETHEILKPVAITRLPNVEPEILGMINLRGNIIPVIDLGRKFFSKYTRITPLCRIIICHQNESHYSGFLVDRIGRVVTLEDDGNEWPEVGDYSGGYFRGVGRNSGRVYLMLDLSVLLSRQ